MTLTVEDGTQVADANSYADLEKIRDYASARGVTLSADDAVVEAFAIIAVDYLEACRANYQGNKVASTQSLQWPRTGVVVDGFDVAETEIPRDLVSAECACVIELAAGFDLMPTSDGRLLIRDKTGSLEQEWAPYIGSSSERFPKVDALLEPLFKPSTGFMTYRA